MAYDSKKKANANQEARRKASGPLSDGAKRRIAQGIMRSTIRWNAFIDYVTNIDHLQVRIETVVDRYGWGGVSLKALMRFMHRSAEQVDTSIMAMKEDGRILSVSRAGESRWITPDHINSKHPRILKNLYPGSDLTADSLNGKSTR